MFAGHIEVALAIGLALWQSMPVALILEAAIVLIGPYLFVPG